VQERGCRESRDGEEGMKGGGEKGGGVQSSRGHQRGGDKLEDHRDEVSRAKAVKAPSTNKVSSGVFFQVQVHLMGQQHKVQETAKVSNSTETTPPLVSANP
jgi:hypothetical protein